MQVKQISLATLLNSSGFSDCCREYAEEILGRTAVPDMAAYEKFEATGVLRILGAFCGERLVAFSVVLLSENLSTGAKVASVNYVYATPQYRSRAGAALLARLMREARETGRELYLTAAANTLLDLRLMGSQCFEPIETVYRYRRR